MRIVCSKFFNYVFIFILGASSQTCVKAQSTSPPVHRTNYTKLVWQDEFNNPGLPDPAKWKYDTGFIANHELQYYTLNRAANVLILDGYRS